MGSLAAQRGLFRNAPAQPLLQAPPRPEDDGGDDEDEDDDDHEGADHPKTWPDVLTPFAQQLAPIVPLLLAQRSAASSTAGPPPAIEASTSSEPGAAEESVASDADLATKGWELRDLVDLNYVARKANARKATQQAREHASRPSTEPVASRKRHARSLQERVMSDPALMQPLVALAEGRPPDAQLIARAATPRGGRRDRHWLVYHLQRLCTEEKVPEVCLQWLRGLHATLATDAGPRRTCSPPRSGSGHRGARHPAGRDEACAEPPPRREARRRARRGARSGVGG